MGLLFARRFVCTCKGVLCAIVHALLVLSVSATDPIKGRREKMSGTQKSYAEFGALILVAINLLYHQCNVQYES